MNIRIHVSYPQNIIHTPRERVWLLPDSVRQKCALLLGGDANNVNSVPIKKGTLTHSQISVRFIDILSSLGREYIEVPAGTQIHYKRALMQGYEYIFEQINGAWTFDSVSDILLEGYTSETRKNNGDIYSIGEMRKSESKRSDGGTRYLLKYTNEQKKYTDIMDVVQFEQDPEIAKKEFLASDELEALIF